MAKNLSGYGGVILAFKIQDTCVACGSCLAECPVNAISEDTVYKINPDLCVDCGACASVCPVEAPIAE